MYSSLPEDIRQSHPFHMIEEIKLQPDAVSRSLALVESRGAAAVQILRDAKRTIFTGCGTSFNAALGGAWLMRELGHAVDARAVQAWDLLSYGTVGSGDAVVGVTHSGNTAMTLRALQRAREAGAETIAVTGFPDAGGVQSDCVVPTGYEDERSWAHTASYTAALATLAALANGIAPAGREFDLAPLHDVMSEALGLEEMMHRLAANVIASDRAHGIASIVVVGGGPSLITAREAVLKLQETSATPARAFHLEEILHGPLASVASDTLLVIVVPNGPATARASELAAAALRLGIEPLVLCTDENAGDFHGSHRLILQDVPEALSTMPYVVPLQLLSYFLAVGKGINPDLIGRQDERQRAARAEYQ